MTSSVSKALFAEKQSASSSEKKSTLPISKPSYATYIFQIQVAENSWRGYMINVDSYTQHASIKECMDRYVNTHNHLTTEILEELKSLGYKPICYYSSDLPERVTRFSEKITRTQFTL